MAVTGKMTVDLYANPDPFVQGMKAAENAAKKSGSGIASSIEKINAKQMKNLSGQLLGGLGVVGMVDAGAKMALEMIKGFKDGSEKGLSGAMEIIGNSLITTIKSIPIAGTFFEIGKSIGEWASGVDAANESIARSNEQMKRTTDIVTKLKALQSPSTALTNQETKNANFGKSADVLAQEQALAEKSKQAQDLYDSQKINASKQTTDRMADYDLKAAQRKEEMLSSRSGPMYDARKEEKNRDEFKVKLGQQEDAQFVALKNQYDEELKLVDAAVEKLKAAQDIGNQNNKNAQESKQNDADLIAAQSALEKLQLDAHQIGMDARDIELERLANMEGMGIEMLTQAMSAWDQLEAEKARVIAQKELDNAKEKSEKEELDRIKKIEDAEIKAKQNARDEAIKAYEDYQEAQDVFAKTAEELDKKAAGVSATTSVDTAIGSVKIAGASDFSVQKEMDIAESTLKEAKNQSDYLKSIDSSLHKLGGGT